MGITSSGNKTYFGESYCLHRFVTSNGGRGYRCLACGEEFADQFEYHIEHKKPANDTCVHDSTIGRAHGIIQCVICAAQFEDKEELIADAKRNQHEVYRNEIKMIIKALLCQHFRTRVIDQNTFVCKDCGLETSSIEEFVKLRYLVDSLKKLPQTLELERAAYERRERERIKAYF